MKAKEHYVLGGRPTQIGMFEVVAKPASKLRCILWDILPYWQGSRPKFKITFKALFDTDCSYNFLSTVEYSNGGEADFKWQLEIPKMNKGKTWETTVNEMYLTYTGDTFLVVTEIMGEGTISEYKPVFIFHVTNRSWLALALLAGILAGALSILGNWLSGCFF